MASLRLAARTFSTSSNNLNLVRPPIAVFGVEGRYASALFSAASKEKQLQNVEKDIKALNDFVKSSGKLTEQLKSPITSKQEKLHILQQIAKEYQISPLTMNAVSAMAENGRLAILSKFLKTFDDILSAARGEVLVNVTTAKALDQQQHKDLMDALQKFARNGQVLKVETHVDPDILGGMIVSIGDKYVDMSIRSKVKLYSKIVEESL